MSLYEAPLDHGPVRLRLGALAGVLGPTLILVRILLGAGFDLSDVPRAMGTAAAHPALIELVNACELFGFSLVAFSAATVTGLVRGRGKWLTQVGGWGTTITWLVIAFNSLGLVMASMAGNPHRHVLAAAIKNFQTSPGALLLLVPLASSAVWIVVLSFGLRRAGLVGWWNPAVALASLLASGLLDGGGVLLDIVAFAPTAALPLTWSYLLTVRRRAVAPSADTTHLATATA